MASILASSGQPNQPPFLPLPLINTLTTGFITSALRKLLEYPDKRFIWTSGNLMQ